MSGFDIVQIQATHMQLANQGGKRPRRETRAISALAARQAQSARQLSMAEIAAANSKASKITQKQAKKENALVAAQASTVSLPPIAPRLVPRNLEHGPGIPNQNISPAELSVNWTDAQQAKAKAAQTQASMIADFALRTAAPNIMPRALAPFARGKTQTSAWKSGWKSTTIAQWKAKAKRIGLVLDTDENNKPSAWLTATNASRNIIDALTGSPAVPLFVAPFNHIIPSIKASSPPEHDGKSSLYDLHTDDLGFCIYAEGTISAAEGLLEGFGTYIIMHKALPIQLGHIGAYATIRAAMGLQNQVAQFNTMLQQAVLADAVYWRHQGLPAHIQYETLRKQISHLSKTADPAQAPVLDLHALHNTPDRFTKTILTLMLTAGLRTHSFAGIELAQVTVEGIVGTGAEPVTIPLESWMMYTVRMPFALHYNISKEKIFAAAQRRGTTACGCEKCQQIVHFNNSKNIFCCPTWRIIAEGTPGMPYTNRVRGMCECDQHWITIGCVLHGSDLYKPHAGTPLAAAKTHFAPIATAFVANTTYIQKILRDQNLTRHTPRVSYITFIASLAIRFDEAGDPLVIAVSWPETTHQMWGKRKSKFDGIMKRYLRKLPINMHMLADLPSIRGFRGVTYVDTMTDEQIREHKKTPSWRITLDIAKYAKSANIPNEVAADSDTESDSAEDELVQPIDYNNAVNYPLQPVPTGYRHGMAAKNRVAL